MNPRFGIHLNQFFGVPTPQFVWCSLPLPNTQYPIPNQKFTYIPVGTAKDINNILVPMHRTLTLNNNKHASSLLVLLLKGSSGYSLTSMVPALLTVLHVCVSLVLWIACDLLLKGHYNTHKHTHAHRVQRVYGSLSN